MVIIGAILIVVGVLSLEYYNTLRMLGVPARLLYFPDEGHGGPLKPQNSRLWYKEFFNWIEKYVGAGPS